MRFFFTALILLLHSSIFAQTDSTREVKTAPFTLTHEQIEQLPATGFSELVNGAFAFMYGAPLVMRDFSFEVDGFSLVSPDALNLSQIESIRFYPLGTDWSKGSLLKKGVFVITTRKSSASGGKGWTFYSKNGIVTADNQFGPGNLQNGTTEHSRPALLCIQELGWSHQWRRSYLQTGLGFMNHDDPQLTFSNGQSSLNSNPQLERYRISVLGGYELNTFWKLDGGLFYTRSRVHTESNTQQPPGYYINHTFASNPPFFTGVHLSLTGKLNNELENNTRLEANESKEKYLLNSNYQLNNGFVTNYSSTPNRLDNFTAADLFSWNHQTKLFTILSSFLFRYRNYNYSSSNYTRIYNSSGIFQSSGYHYELKSTSITAAPSIGIHFKQILLAEAGIVLEHYQTSQFSPENQKPQWMPQANAEMNFIPLLSSTGLTTLALKFSYEAYLPFYDQMDLSDQQVNPLPLASYGSPVYFYPNPSLGVKPAKRWMGSISLGAFQDRLNFRVQYLKENLPLLLMAPVAYGYGGYTIVQQNSERKAWSAELNAAILSKEKTKWNLQAVVFNDFYSLPVNLYPGDVISVNTVIPFHQDKPWLRGSVKMDGRFHQFYLQASSFFDLHRVQYVLTAITNYSDHYQVNFLILGYHFSPSVLRQLSINLQARNLITPKNESVYNKQWRYYGVGLSIAL